MTIAGHMNTNDNVGSSAATNDKESYEFALTFAFNLFRIKILEGPFFKRGLFFGKNDIPHNLNIQ